MDHLYNFWFDNEDKWFNSTPENDEIITKKFSHLITKNLDMTFILNCCTDKQILAYILVYDQIIRHVYRGDEIRIKKLSLRSLYLSVKLIDRGLDKEFSPQERIFILLPFRHTFFTPFIKLAIEKVQEYMQESESPYYLRFYRASLLSLATIEAKDIKIEPVFNEITNADIISNLDTESSPHFDKVLYDKQLKDPIITAIKWLLKDIGNPKEITLSLSGGVDSMVCSYALYHISKKWEKFKVIAVNIDYGNRGEVNMMECEFVKRWCVTLGLPLYIRHITVIKRDRSNNRDLYEKVTREMRFAMYKRFGNPVILGHNFDDCLENIFNNIKKVQNYDNLKGMKLRHDDNGCTILRPLLNISKANIKNFAKKYNIPHLPNSTPTWSERGRIRDQLIPFLEDFDQDIIPGLVKLANNMNGMYNIYHSSVIEDFYKANVKISPNQVFIKLEENAREKKYDFIFWKDIFIKIFQEINERFPSNDSLLNITNRIQWNQYGLIQMNRTTRLQYNNLSLSFSY